MPNPANHKVVAYLIGSLGDTIVTIPALRAVRRQFADSEIVLLQNSGVDGRVQSAEVIPPELIDRIITYNSEMSGASKLLSFARLRRLLANERFDAAVYLAGSQRPPRTVRRDRIYFRSCGIRQLIGFHPFDERELYPRDAGGRPAPVANEAVRKLERMGRDGVRFPHDEMLSMPLIRAAGADREIAEQWLLQHRRKPTEPLIAIAPGSKTSANLWTEEKFTELALRLSALKYELVIVGGPAEAALGDRLVRAIGGGLNAAGQFSVSGSAALLATCNSYIGVDSGTTHLAAAVGTRCFIVNHDRNHPGQWFPLGTGHMLVSHAVECGGCILRECPVASHPCMSGISVDSAWIHLMNFLDDPTVLENRLIWV